MALKGEEAIAWFDTKVGKGQGQNCKQQPCHSSPCVEPESQKLRGENPNKQGLKDRELDHLDKKANFEATAPGLARSIVQAPSKDAVLDGINDCTKESHDHCRTDPSRGCR